MRVAVVQFHAVEGDVSQNLASIVQLIKTEKKYADLFVFPELALTGYLDDERALAVALPVRCKEFTELKRATRGVGAVIGFVERGEGDVLFNSAAYFENGVLVHVHRKVSLVNYGKFKETQCYSPGFGVECFSLGEFTACILICNDAWHPEMAMIASLQGAEVFIVPAAAAFDGLADLLDNKHCWEKINQYTAMLYGGYVIFANYSGKRRGRADFLGNSTIIDPHGEVTARVSLNRKGSSVAKLEKPVIEEVRAILPTAQNMRIDIVMHELGKILHSRTTKQ